MFDWWKQEAKQASYETQLKMEKKTNEKPHNIALPVLGSICLRFFHAEVSLSLFGLYEDFRKILYRTNFALS